MPVPTPTPSHLDATTMQYLVDGLLLAVKILGSVIVVVGGAFISVLAWLGKGLYRTMNKLSDIVSEHDQDIVMLKTAMGACEGCSETYPQQEVVHNRRVTDHA